MNNRRRFRTIHILTISVLLLVACEQTEKKETSLSNIQKPTPTHKNVLVLISDDQGADQLGCYGNQIIQTPNLDKLAEQSIRFTNAFAVSASCSSSRGTVFTGLYPHQNGQYGHLHGYNHFSLREHVQTLPQLLKANGYHIGLLGKRHVAPDSKFPFDIEIGHKKLKEIGGGATSMAKKASEFFNSDTEKPFFLYVGFSEPHRGKNGFGDIDSSKYDPNKIIVPPFLPNQPEVREELAGMYASISQMDNKVGLILEELKKSGRYENTLIIYISDHGIPFPGAKTNMYDPALRIPMIVYSPKIKKRNTENKTLVSLLDITPTILDWTSSSQPDYKLSGKSFLPVLNNPNSSEGWDEIYQSHTYHEITMFYPMRGIRSKQFHYIKNLNPEIEFPFASDLFRSQTWQGILKRKDKMMGNRTISTYLKRPSEELYDMEKDPDELNNLAAIPEYQDTLKKMREKVQQFRVDTKDPWLINDKYIENKTLY